MSSIFLSHSHVDASLAACFETFLHTITSKQLDIHRSSKSGSIEYGDSWIEWINERVTQSKLSFILLTPSSFSSKWVLWEAGAVSGVRRASSDHADEEERTVIPVKFAISSEAGLGPFQSQQIADGLVEDDVIAMSRAVLAKLRENGVPGNLVDDALMNLSETAKSFVSEAREQLKRLEVYRREDLVLEWVTRLDEALHANHADFVNSAKRWICIAFLGEGEADNSTRPIDFRLHTRLAKGYTSLGNWESARDQLELACRLSPRDMLVQRELGRVALETGNLAAACQCFKDMEKLDETVLFSDPEALNLYVRTLVAQNNWPAAQSALEAATMLAGIDPYVANMLAIATIKVKGLEPSQDYFRRLQSLEPGIDECGIWSLGNLTNAALGLGERELAVSLLERLSKIPEAQLRRESIARYFDTIIDANPAISIRWRDHWPN